MDGWWDCVALDQFFTSTNTTDPWIEKYIFPDSMLPSASKICTKECCGGIGMAGRLGPTTSNIHIYKYWKLESNYEKQTHSRQKLRALS